MSEQAVGYGLPAALIGRADLARLIREIEAVDNELESQKVRAASANQPLTYRMPTTSRSLSDFIELNGINLSDDKQRLAVREQLRGLKDTAPVVHMTFAVDADPDFLQQLTYYMRTQIHPHTLLSFGLQPSLIGGVYMRTPNHVHDFSVRELLSNKRGIIKKELDTLLSAPHPAPPEPEQAEV